MSTKKNEREILNKGELAALMAKNSGSSKTEAEKSLNLVLDTIIEALKAGHNINLINFGSFQVQDRLAREGRNPKTGEKMQIAAYKQPVFKAGKRMKDSV